VLQKNKAGMFKKNILAIPVNYQKKTRRVPSKTSNFFQNRSRARKNGIEKTVMEFDM